MAYATDCFTLFCIIVLLHHFRCFISVLFNVFRLAFYTKFQILLHQTLSSLTPKPVKTKVYDVTAWRKWVKPWVTRTEYEWVEDVLTNGVDMGINPDHENPPDPVLKSRNPPTDTNTHIGLSNTI
eukprot:1128446_1